jgi:phage terminase large subunit
MKLNPKQSKALRYLEDDTTTEVLYGGGAGGGKSALGVYWLLKSAFKYPGSRALMSREILKSLKDTTLMSFFEVCQMQGILSDMYDYNETKGRITIKTSGQDSIIFLRELFFYPRDAQFNSLGSLEITRIFIDEANQVVEKAKEVAMSRIRYKLDEFKLVPKMLMTCNPAKNWTYQQFYKPAKEGTIEPYRKFIQALVGDNKNISKHYVENLKKMSKASRERLLFGNWEFDDDPATLISYDAILDLFTNTHVVGKHRYITADIALQGSDKFVIFVWEGWRVIHCEVMPKSDGKEVETKLRELSEKFKVGQSRICYDADGVGGFLKGYLANAKPFNNGASPIEIKGSHLEIKPQYQNLKSQCYFGLAEKINAREVYVPDLGVENKQFLIEELEYVKSNSYGTDKKLAVLPKDKIKEFLGRSPDFSDALMMRYYFELVPEIIYIPHGLM